MKRWLICSFISVAAFAVGSSIVSFYLILSTSTFSSERVIEAPISITAPSVSETYFIPEFRELPNFENVTGDSPMGTKLVDLKEYDENTGVYEYRKSEIIAKNGERWLGLFKEGGVFSFKSVKVNVRHHHTPRDPDNEPFYAFRFHRNTIPLILTKDLKSLKPGKVMVIYSKEYSNKDGSENTDRILNQGFREEASLFDKTYVLRVTKGLTGDGTKVNVLVLESENSQQIITYNLHYQDSTTVYDSIGELLIAGDLDGDRKLDLYISEFGFEKGGFGTQLFLSSEAGEGKMVTLSAVFGTAGC